MGLIKKIDVEKHFAERRAMRLGRTGPLSQAGARVEPTANAKTTESFFEDVIPGHSSLGAPVTPIPIAGNSDGTNGSTVSRSRQA